MPKNIDSSLLNILDKSKEDNAVNLPNDEDNQEMKLLPGRRYTGPTPSEPVVRNMPYIFPKEPVDAEKMIDYKKKGGKINLDHCKVNTAEGKNSKHKNCW
jgi:hypothetical protein